MLQQMTATADILRADEAQGIDTAYRRLTAATAEMQRLQHELEGLYDRERKKAEDDGREAGIQMGLQVLTDIDRAAQSFLRSIEQDIAALAITIAERIIGRYDEREQVLRAASCALQELGPEDAAILSVSSKHFNDLTARLKNAQGATGRPVPCVLQADARLDTGDCRLETARGVIDVNVARQLEALRQSVRAWNGEESTGDAERI